MNRRKNKKGNVWFLVSLPISDGRSTIRCEFPFNVFCSYITHSANPYRAKNRMTLDRWYTDRIISDPTDRYDRFAISIIMTRTRVISKIFGLFSVVLGRR